MCANFQAKRTSLRFLTQVWPKIELGLEIKKCNIGIKTINDGKIARVKKDVNITSDKWGSKSFRLTFKILELTVIYEVSSPYFEYDEILFSIKHKQKNSDFFPPRISPPHFFSKQRSIEITIKKLKDGAEWACSKFCKSRTYLLIKHRTDYCWFNNFLYLLVNSDTAIASMTSIMNKNE